jgi:hypothetical protein
MPPYSRIVHRNTVFTPATATFAGSILLSFASAFPKITQPHLKPSFFGPIPILGEETVAVVWTIVHFALDKNKLP